MSLAFHAKFVSKCANGHLVSAGQLIAYDDRNNILCDKCPEFTSRHSAHKVELRSGKFCPKCFLELALNGSCDFDCN